jgi:hypothetical protein
MSFPSATRLFAVLIVLGLSEGNNQAQSIAAAESNTARLSNNAGHVCTSSTDLVAAMVAPQFTPQCEL